MPELEQLHAGHAPAVQAFELANRAYFAASVSDRGDDFFAQFTNRSREVTPHPPPARLDTRGPWR